jgi:hypothetical protein
MNTKGEEVTIPAQGRFLIAFLDTECGPCKRQVDPLNEALEKRTYSGVLAVFSEPEAKVTEFESSVKPEFVCLRDVGRGPLAENRISTFPQTIEVDNGIVTRSWVGYQGLFE